jgi:hypothetical protein
MTPQEQAKEIIRKYYSVGAVECQDCALLAVDLILTALDVHQWQNRHETVYWKEVKHEIEKLL